jgi:hypothetical protein
VPEFPIDTALLGVVGAVIAVAIKVLLGKKRKDNAPLVPKPPPTNTKVHEAATTIVQEEFDEGISEISDANAEESEDKRLKRLADLANLAKRR